MSNDCQLLERKSKGGNHLARKHHGPQCRNTFQETWHGYALKERALHVGLHGDIKHTKKGTRIITFIHIIPRAVSLNDGDVLFENLRIIPQKCKRNLKNSCKQLSRRAVASHKEVFTISQFWGNGFYHGTLEDLPRIAPYLPFLQKHRQIRIHVPPGIKYLDLLGIEKRRLTTDSVVHADILYMPAGGPCGNSPLFTTQLLADLIRRNVNLTTSTERNVVVLIKRSKKRWFANHDAIYAMLQRHASHFNLTVEVFADNPLPSLDKTIEMFGRALVVIAPHGAGEANLIFSQAGTLLIEGLCYDSDNMTNLCFRNMAQALGLRYYGLIYPYQCMQITPEQIERPFVDFIRNYFKYQIPSSDHEKAK